MAALRQLREPIGELLDGAQPAVASEVRTVAGAVTGVAALDKCLVRKAGRAFYVDLHVEVDPDLSVRQGHAIAHRVQSAIRASNPRIVDVLVHRLRERIDHDFSPKLLHTRRGMGYVLGVEPGGD